MRLAEGQSLVNFSKVAHEEITEEAESTEGAAQPAADTTVTTAEETTPEN